MPAVHERTKQKNANFYLRQAQVSLDLGWHFGLWIFTHITCLIKDVYISTCDSCVCGSTTFYKTEKIKTDGVRAIHGIQAWHRLALSIILMPWLGPMVALGRELAQRSWKVVEGETNTRPFFSGQQKD